VITTDQALEALREVMDPELGRSIVELGMVKDLSIDDGKISFTLALTTPTCPLRDRMSAQSREALMLLDGIREVEVKMGELTAEEKARIMPGKPQQREGAAEHLNRIEKVIAVMSGKGGVGKSLVSGLLAVALRRWRARPASRSCLLTCCCPARTKPSSGGGR